MVTSSQTAKCTTQALWAWFVVHCGLPESIILIRVRILKVISFQICASWQRYGELCMIPYHPQTNGQFKWLIPTLIDMLGTLHQIKKSSWRDMAWMLVHAYNCTRSTGTGSSLYYLMYGQRPQLPVKLYFGTQRADINVTKSNKFVH